MKRLRSVACAATVFLAVAPVSAAGPGLGQNPRVKHLVDDYAESFSPDGRTIVFSRWFSTQRYGVDPHPSPKRAVLILMRADGSGKRVLRHPGATFEYDAGFSPEGRSIVFVRDERIYVMRRNGSGAHPLRRDSLEQACPRFSPDGSMISLWRGRTAKSGAYFVMSSDGTGLRRIARVGRDPPWGCPSWFPDGKRLVFVKRYNLYVASMGSASIQRITDDGDGTFYRPSVSPDGRWIACDGDSRSGSGITVLRADGTRIRRITSRTDEFRNDSGPSWSPNRKRILFSGYRPLYEGAGVYVVRPDGGGLRRLSNFRR
ncbi:MAG TPA: DPP IV N-terminal domain-containing protein [Gaiellaceae bacterium]|jgi:Tol biopolymer transport system component|nr:DPP IV N-terminal domain-containing protein [Gaiellaceae bacterium]